MTKEKIKILLPNLFEIRQNGDGVSFATDYMFNKNSDGYTVYQAVSDAMRESGLSFDFSYTIANKAVDILSELENWEDEDTKNELCSSSVPVYNNELMKIYLSDWWAVDEVMEETSQSDSVAMAQMAWDRQIENMVNQIIINLNIQNND